MRSGMTRRLKGAADPQSAKSGQIGSNHKEEAAAYCRGMEVTEPAVGSCFDSRPPQRRSSSSQCREGSSWRSVRPDPETKGI